MPKFVSVTFQELCGDSKPYYYCNGTAAAIKETIHRYFERILVPLSKIVGLGQMELLPCLGLGIVQQLS